MRVALLPMLVGVPWVGASCVGDIGHSSSTSSQTSYDTVGCYPSFWKACLAAGGKVVPTRFFGIATIDCACGSQSLNPWFNDCVDGLSRFVGDVGRVCHVRSPRPTEQCLADLCTQAGGESAPPPENWCVCDDIIFEEDNYSCDQGILRLLTEPRVCPPPPPCPTASACRSTDCKIITDANCPAVECTAGCKMECGPCQPSATAYIDPCDGKSCPAAAPECPSARQCTISDCKVIAVPGCDEVDCTAGCARCGPCLASDQGYTDACDGKWCPPSRPDVTCPTDQACGPADCRIIVTSGCPDVACTAACVPPPGSSRPECEVEDRGCGPNGSEIMCKCDECWEDYYCLS
jgi:hypothetical protein